MRIATWNVNSLKAREERFRWWLASREPDVVLLQETKARDFPLELPGWQVHHVGEGARNGVAVLVRDGLDMQPVPDPAWLPQWEGHDEARLAAAWVWDGTRPVHVRSVYVPNGRAVDHPHFAYKLEWLDALKTHLSALSESDTPTLVGGDFNVAPSDADVWDRAAFDGSTHVTPAERHQLAVLLALAPEVRPEPDDRGRTFTYYDYTAGRFQRGEGMRIDLFLASHRLGRAVSRCWIDREARRLGSVKDPVPGKPSDHCPVLLDVDLAG